MKCLTPGPLRLEDCSVEMLRSRLGRTVSLVTSCDLLSPHLRLSPPPNILLSKLCLEFSLSHATQLPATLVNLSALISKYLYSDVITLTRSTLQGPGDICFSWELWGSLTTILARQDSQRSALPES